MVDGGSDGGSAKKRTKLLHGRVKNYMVSPPVTNFRRQVRLCCDCTWNLTCSTLGPSDQSCVCCNTGPNCTACVFWQKCFKRKESIPSPNTTRGILVHFVSGAVWPTTSVPVQAFPKSQNNAPPTTRAWGGEHREAVQSGILKAGGHQRMRYQNRKTGQSW